MIELQRKLLGDKVRNQAFHDALKKVIKKGETTVVDLGSGTGFLSFLASRLGAKSCLCFESGDIATVSKELAKRNGIKNCTIIKEHSTSIRNVPENAKCDVLVSETLGNYALEENIIESVEDAKRFLKPNGIVIPGKIKQFVAPVITDRLHKDIDIWDDVGFDMQWDEAREIAQNNMYVKAIRPNEIGEASAWDTIDFSQRNKSVRTATVSIKASQTIYGFALWWEAELVPGVVLSTSPSAPATHWEQIYLPLLKPVTLKAGETSELSLKSDTRWEVKINLEWSFAGQKMDMRKGHLN